MSVVTIDVLTTSNVATTVVWTALTGSARGGVGVAITDYEVYWNQGPITNTWVHLASTTSLSTYVTGLVGGTTYGFELRAYNKYGPGLFTAQVSMMTSQAPDTPAAPTITVVGAHVEIAWTAPVANFSPVLGYKILIQTKAGTYLESTAMCDGEAQALVHYCLVAMDDLRASPFNLAYHDLVVAEVLARNSRGWSLNSLPNTDAPELAARIQVEPLAMAPPERGALTGPTQLDVYWSTLTTP